MTSFRTVLAATDFSVEATRAVRRAALLAQECKARLSIVHVVNLAGCKPLRDWFARSIDIDLKTAQAQSTLLRFAAEIAGQHDVAVSFEVLVGDPVEELLQSSQQADLVVLGHRGHNRLKQLLIGRTSDRLLRLCRRPVLVVKNPVAKPYWRVLVPIDFTPSSAAAVGAAVLVARDIGLHVFHAIDARRDAVLREADVAEGLIRELRAREEAAVSARMRRSVSRLGLDSRQMNFVLGHGPAVRSILIHAQTLGADLIVAGKQGRSTLAKFLLGTVSSRLLTGSSCDVLIVPLPISEPLDQRALKPVQQSKHAAVESASRARDATASAGALTHSGGPVATSHARESGQRRYG